MFAGLRRWAMGRDRVAVRRPYVQFELDRRRQWIERQLRVEWSKMTKWEKRRNWFVRVLARGNGDLLPCRRYLAVPTSCGVIGKLQAHGSGRTR